jgi:hypothetical protein
MQDDPKTVEDMKIRLVNASSYERIDKNQIVFVQGSL